MHIVRGWLALALGLFACGDDGPAAVDAPPTIDSPPVNCTVSTPSFGDAGSITGEMSYAKITANAEDYLGMLRLEAGSPYDGLLVDLQAGSSNAPDPLVPGTIALIERDTKSTTCGHCISIWTNLVGTTPPEWVQSHDAEYMASKGQLVINSIDHAVGGTIDFTLTGLAFRHVDGAVNNPDGCMTEIASVHVTATLILEQ